MANEAGAFKRLFPHKHIPFVFTAIFQAAANFHKETQFDKEDKITRRLHARLVKIAPFRDGPLSVQLQPEIPSPNMDSGLPAGRIDLLVPSQRGYQIYFAIEAKRLRYHHPNGDFKSGNNAYIKDGMMRFVTAQYSPFVNAGSMLGYVFDGQTTKARNDISKLIQKKANELMINPPQGLKQSRILRDNQVDETSHDLEGRQFTLYHIFLAI